MSIDWPSLLTERFTIRLWGPDDIADLLDLDDDPDVIRHVGPVWPRERRAQAWHEVAHDPGARPCLVIHERAGGAFLGWIFLRPFADGTTDWELGYRLRKAAWGRGVASECARALVGWGWTRPEINVICAVYEPENTASRAVMLKLGMTDAGFRDYRDEGPLACCMMARPDGCPAP